MKNFNYSVLVALTPLLESEIVGQYISRVFHLSENDFYFELSKKNQGLFISLNNPNPFIDLTTTKIIIPKADRDSHLFTIIRHHLEKGKIIAITLVEGQKVVKIEIEKHYENFETKHFFIYIELVVAHPNLVILDQDLNIVSVFRSSKDFSGSRILRIGQSYHLPYLLNPFTAGVIAFIPGDFTRHYLDENRLLINQKNHQKLFRHLKSGVKRLTTKKEKILNELTEVIAPEDANLFGTLLLTYQPEIVSASITLDGVTIMVNPEDDAVKNATKWFNRAKKSRQTLISKNEQLLLIEHELEYLQQLNQMILSFNDEELKEVESELGLTSSKHLQKNQVPTFKPYYLVYKNVKIGFGKNNLQNDYLTFKIANKSDTFMHIKGQPGAHIIIFTQEPQKEIIEFAAQLGLYLAKSPSATFSITKKKYVKKATFPGSVILDKESSVFQKSNDLLVEQYFSSVKRF